MVQMSLIFFSQIVGGVPQNLAHGDNVVFVPLIGLSSKQGVLEIHGLHVKGVTDPKLFQRPINAIKAMIRAKDFE